MFTLKDLLKTEPIKEYTVISPLTLDESTPIEHICVTEPPADNFIRKNEAVLTTAMGCFENEKLFLEFVRDVYDSQAAAFVISAKKPYPKIPQAVLDFSLKHSFPIIYIPWEYRFSEIVENVLSSVSNAVSMEKGFLDSLQKELLTSYLNSQDISCAAGIISKYLDCGVLITTDNFVIKGSSSDKYLSDKEFSAFGSNTAVISLHNNTVFYGYLILISDESLTLPFDKEQLEQHAVMPLSLWFNQESVIKRITNKYKDEFIHKLINGGFLSEKELAAECSHLKLRYKPPYTCVVGKIMPKFPSETAESEILFHSSAIRTIIESALNFSGSKNLSPLVAIQENSIIIFTENSIYKTEKAVNSLLDSIEYKLGLAFPEYIYLWGISEISSSRMDFEKKYKNALLALTICTDKKYTSNRGTYRDTSIFKILSAVSSDREIMEAANKALFKLIQYDGQKNPILLKTLVTYIKNNYSISKTAKELNLHRQSLLYRLDKIQELAEISLHSHSDMFLMEIYSRLLYNYNDSGENNF